MARGAELESDQHLESEPETEVVKEGDKCDDSY